MDFFENRKVPQNKKVQPVQQHGTWKSADNDTDGALRRQRGDLKVSLA